MSVSLPPIHPVHLHLPIHQCRHQRAAGLVRCSCCSSQRTLTSSALNLLNFLVRPNNHVTKAGDSLTCSANSWQRRSSDLTAKKCLQVTSGDTNNLRLTLLVGWDQASAITRRLRDMGAERVERVLIDPAELVRFLDCFLLVRHRCALTCSGQSRCRRGTSPLRRLGSRQAAHDARTAGRVCRPDRGRHRSCFAATLSLPRRS